MKTADDVVHHGIELYRYVAKGKRPRFVDKELGNTVVRLVEGNYRLRIEKHAYSIAAPNGEQINFIYRDATVAIEIRDSRSQIEPRCKVTWEFADPHCYVGHYVAFGEKRTWKGDHNDFPLATMRAIGLQHRTSSTIEIETQGLAKFCIWHMLSEDFRFQFRRRVVGCIPTSYFVAHMRARVCNQLGCGAFCFLAALGLEAGPFDIVAWALCLACSPSALASESAGGSDDTGDDDGDDSGDDDGGGGGFGGGTTLPPKESE